MANPNTPKDENGAGESEQRMLVVTPAQQPVVRDVKFENEFSTLRDKNTHIVNERRKY